MLRRLHHEQPASFEFTSANLAWAEAQMTKFPVGRQASAVIPLLFRAQEQEGWLSKPAIEYVADMLGMPYMRVLEVATFYFMFQLAPVGSVAHIQICGTTSCMICGSEDLMKVCREKIAAHPFELSADGKLSWEEVECLGACANAPMAQIGKDYYEDLTEENLGRIIDDLRAGKAPRPGSQVGRFSSEPAGGLTSCIDMPGDKEAANGSVGPALAIGDVAKKIDGTEVPLRAPWQTSGQRGPIGIMGAGQRPMSAVQQAAAAKAAPKAEAPKPAPKAEAPAAAPAEAPKGTKPAMLTEARGGKADDLKMIKGVGPKLEALLHSLGVFHFDQIAGWKADELDWIDDNLEGFKGRASRDNWVEQAAKLASGAETEFSARAKKDGIYE
jgi:NADH-quinone oxidoreductase subunit E